ncbi:uncharacterized protein DS421_15g509160 [Arachis hypogaea]|nr:uncharacterized protein DS421_15g509160 [Arachis hypogaea]
MCPHRRVCARYACASLANSAMCARAPCARVRAWLTLLLCLFMLLSTCMLPSLLPLIHA